MAQTMRQSTSTCNCHSNTELKLNSELELVGLSSTISSQEININFSSALTHLIKWLGLYSPKYSCKLLLVS